MWPPTPHTFNVKALKPRSRRGPQCPQGLSMPSCPIPLALWAPGRPTMPASNVACILKKQKFYKASIYFRISTTTLITRPAPPTTSPLCRSGRKPHCG